MDNKTTNIPENTSVEVPVTQADSEQITSAESIISQSQPEVVEEKPKKRRFWQSPRFIFSVILILVLVGLVLWLINVFNVYNRATVYQKSHDIAVKELNFCDKIEGTSQPKEVFDYCDELKDRFKEVER